MAAPKKKTPQKTATKTKRAKKARSYDNTTRLQKIFSLT
jgi:hypothetical protein